MDQDERLAAAIDTVRSAMLVEPVALDASLTDVSGFLKLMRVRNANWRAQHLPKIAAHRFTVTFPSLDALTMTFYPRVTSPAPIFLMFFLLTGRRIISHININAPFHDAGYTAHWVTPLVDIKTSLGSSEVKDRYPDWMQKYRNACTVFGMFGAERLDDLTTCGLRYLDRYAARVAETPDETDAGRLRTISAFHAQFRDDIRTKDKAQGMMAKFIGKEKARRVMYEVMT